MKRPKELAERLRDGDTDPVFCMEVMRYIEAMERAYKAACKSADGYKDNFHEVIS